MTSTAPDRSPDASAPLTPAVLDAQALGRLRELDPHGVAGVVNKVLTTYASSLERLKAQFESARQAGDLAAVRALAHTLKSSSASVGAMDLSAACRSVEDAIREGGSPPLDPLAREMDRAALAVADALAGKAGA